jgi:hypothetical protein
MMGIDPIALIGLIAAVIAALYLLKTVLSKVKGGGKESKTGLETHIYKECAVCGWSGAVSKYVKKCSNCGADLY